jgi:probable F420-dependent oxidoreductase
MKVGVMAFATQDGLRPDDLAVEVEARGLSALMFPEHSHIPLARAAAYPDVYGGGELPGFYMRTYDPFVSCTLAAAATTTLRVGTGICLIALREPVHTAKEVASVSYLSGGRFNFGVGFGWNADEFENLGVPFKGRHRLVREKVQLMKRLWEDDVASYQGELLSLQPSWSWPKPVDGPPIFLGGNGPLTMKHAAEWADVWYPTPPAEDRLLTASVPAFKALVAEAGRDPECVEIGCAPGDVTRSDLDAYATNGVTYVNVGMVTTSRDDDLRRLDEIAKRAQDYIGSF